MGTLIKNQTPAVAIQAGALRENPDSGPDGVGVQEHIAYTLEARAEVQAVATLAIRGRGDDSNFEFRTDGTANALLTPNGGRAGIGVGAIQSGMAVRRLTPAECEKLQGFPPNYTAIPGAADGPRYKALGNSMAVPCMAWIGRRIQKLS
jgi:DNA (cytosine-5)-methyltransferase 1